MPEVTSPKHTTKVGQSIRPGEEKTDIIPPQRNNRNKERKQPDIPPEYIPKRI